MTANNFLLRFFKDWFQYKDYIVYYIKSLEKSRVSNTTLGFIWWFLDPVLNMVIYIILVRVAFDTREDNYPVFFFSAMLVWRYFSMAVQQAANSISSGAHICKDNYIPKFIFPLSLCFSSLTPFIFSLGVLFLLMPIFQIPMTPYLLYLPLLVFLLFLFTCACSMLCAHLNIFMNDFGKILPHLIMVGMFATPIFYDITQIPDEYVTILKLNPMSILTTSFRNIFLYGTHPPLKQLTYLIALTIVTLIFSIYLLYKYDQTYNRVSR